MTAKDELARYYRYHDAMESKFIEVKSRQTEIEENLKKIAELQTKAQKAKEEGKLCQFYAYTLLIKIIIDETNEKMVKDDPETVEAFMAALTEGYEFAIEHPADSADVLIQAVPDLDEELVKRSQEWLSPRYQDDAARWGEQKLEVWENYSEWMFDNGLLEKELEADKAFTNKFLPKRGN